MPDIYPPHPPHPPTLLKFDELCSLARAIDAPCVAGWGFTDTTNLRSVGVAAKRAQLLAFSEQVLDGRPAVWVGASLGACIALDCYRTRPEAVASIVTLAPGFFTPPPPVVPGFVGKLLLSQVLAAPNVRETIAKQAYFDKDAQTDDAIRCGNLHLNRAAWEADSLEWLLSGAYGDLSSEVALLDALPTLTLWGREDEVIPPAGLGSWPAARLARALPTGTFRWVERSGHTPHLEQPAVCAAAISAFVRNQPVAGDADVSAVTAAADRFDTAREVVNTILRSGAEQLSVLRKAVVARLQDGGK